jgi:hypothetical protein
MTRAIKDEIDAEFADVNELFEYLVSCRSNDVNSPQTPYSSPNIHPTTL